MGKSSWGSFVPVMERICRRLSDIFFFILSLSRSFFRLLPSRGTLPMEFYKTIPLLVSQQTYKPIRRWIRDSFDPPPLGSQYRADSKRRVLFGVKPWKTRKILLSNASRTMDSCHSLFNSPAKTVFALSIVAVYACVCVYRSYSFSIYFSEMHIYQVYLKVNGILYLCFNGGIF